MKYNKTLLVIVRQTTNKTYCLLGGVYCRQHLVHFGMQKNMKILIRTGVITTYFFLLFIVFFCGTFDDEMHTLPWFRIGGHNIILRISLTNLVQ